MCDDKPTIEIDMIFDIMRKKLWAKQSGFTDLFLLCLANF